MTPRESNSATRPTTLTIVGLVLLAAGGSAAVISFFWIGFSAPISEAGRELAGDLGAIAAPLEFALPVGVGVLAIGTFTVWTARSLLQQRRWALKAVKVIVVAAMIGWIAWMIMFLMWMLGQPRLTADAPPAAASVMIAVLATAIGLGVLGTVTWLLNREDVAGWINHSEVPRQ